MCKSLGTKQSGCDVGISLAIATVIVIPKYSRSSMSINVNHRQVKRIVCCSHRVSRVDHTMMAVTKSMSLEQKIPSDRHKYRLITMQQLTGCVLLNIISLVL